MTSKGCKVPVTDEIIGQSAEQRRKQNAAMTATDTRVKFSGKCPKNMTRLRNVFVFCLISVAFYAF